MKLMDKDAIQSILNDLVGYKFTTQDFIFLFRENLSEAYGAIVDEYGVGGKGAGRNYSSNVHIGKSLSKFSENSGLSFIEYIKAPKAWGSPVIALWDYNPNDKETVRIGMSIEGDISAVINNDDLSNTEKESLILSRVGQGRFRKKLIEYWESCPVTKCEDSNLLVASHIKPWSESNNHERLDVFNGLLLTPNIDRLFDKGLISFADSGELLVSSFLSKNSTKLFDVHERIKIALNEKHTNYMIYHRENIFETKG